MKKIAIDLSRAVLVPKETKVEYDSRRLKLTEHQLQTYYRSENSQVIFASHKRQLEMRRRLRTIHPEIRVVSRDDLSAKALEGASCVISLGGDNHFIFVSHFLDATPIIGVNADRIRSHGGLLSLDERNVESVLRRIGDGQGRLDLWPRIDAFVDGKPVGRATSEILAGERGRKDMSRHALSLNGGKEEEQKSSGLLVCTAAGSTGWFSAYAKPFPRGRAEARWVLTEPFPRDRKYKLRTGAFKAGGRLGVRSLNDSEGLVSVDCLRDAPFPFGSVAEFRLSEEPLRVLGG